MTYYPTSRKKDKEENPYLEAKMKRKKVLDEVRKRRILRMKAQKGIIS